MTKFKLKDEKHSKAVTSFRAKKGSNMTNVILGRATQVQLARLHELKNPLVVEDKSATAK